MSYEISLVDLLKNKNPDLHGRLADIRKKAKTLLSYTHGTFPYYTPHDFFHSESVEDNLNWLIPDPIKNEMNSHELFFLITAAWLHDWGMVSEEGEDPEAIRDEHHIRTENNFESLYNTLQLSSHEAQIVGRISKGHRKVDLNSDEYADVVFSQNIKIRRRFLSALLRIADECDITHNRTPEVVYYSINPKGVSESEFQKHLSISGVGQLEEKHKIHINAIARDPKAARTLREVAQKIQRELNGVKTILGQHGVPLDFVDLKLEARGFIDKPIAFEIDSDKIVDLLIGDHLYSHQDVAIRELVQNSVDSCKLSQTLDSGRSCMILLSITKDNLLIIEDNGLGMGYHEAKEFLSTIGSSFYKSQQFQDQFGKKGYSPIGQYGIGILSCFLISNKITIETAKNGYDPCKFSIGSINQEWKYEKGSLPGTGTKITLALNEEGRELTLEASLRRYFLCPEIPIEYTDRGGETKTFSSCWDAEHARQTAQRWVEGEQRGSLTEVINVRKPDYDVILGNRKHWSRNNMLLFNHGGRIHIRSATLRLWNTSAGVL